MRRAAALLGPLVAWCALLVLLSSRPGSALPAALPGVDKAAHFAAYAVLGVLAARAARGLALARGAAWLAALGFCALFGVSDEWHQSFVPQRSVEVWDWVADTLGGAAGAGLLLARAPREARPWP